MEMMHQVWAAGLHDSANCFQDALEAKWKLKSQKQAKPKTNGDKIRSMTNEELAEAICDCLSCAMCPAEKLCAENEGPGPLALESWLRSPVEESDGET